MMIPKWLLPVLAGITAIAVGAASAILTFVLLGGATPASDAVAAPAPVETEIVPLVAPVAYGDEAPPVDLDGDPETDDVSPYLGSATVPVSTVSGEPPSLEPGSDGAIIGDDPDSIADLLDAETLATIDTLAAADDPAAAPGLLTLFDGGDPCALPDAPSESCPEGLRSRILSSTGLPPLYMFANPSPPLSDVTDPDLLTCDPLELAEGEARFAVGTNLPVAVTITYWPMGNRADARTLSIDTPESEVALFEADPPRQGAPFTVLKHCVVLDGLETATRYQVHVVAETAAGERRERTHYLALGVDLTRPPARFVPIGDNIVLVSATHRDRETVLLRAGLLDDESSTDCADIDTLQPLLLVSEPTTRNTSRPWLERNGYLPEFTKRTGGAFFVPEGRNALFCAGSYDSARPSWNWEIADYTVSTVVQAPDVTIPRFTWTGASVRESSGIAEVLIAVAPRGSRECAPRVVAIPVAPEWFTDQPTGGLPLCEYMALDGYDYVNTGTFVVHTVARIGREHIPTAAGLPLGRERCVGVCEVLPATSHYAISLPLVETRRGLCGSSFGECDPPTSTVSGGTVHLRVDWEHGARNGAQEWSVGPIIEAAGVPIAFDEPQFDTTAFPRFIDDVTGTRLEFALRSDRPVNYRATLSGNCLLPETSTVVEGRFESEPVPVAFDNPCRGGTYSVVVELTDDDGRSIAYGPTIPGTTWSSLMSVPGTSVELNVSYRLTLKDAAGRATSGIQPRVMVDENGLFRATWIHDRCVFGGIVSGFDSSGLIEVADIVPITATMTLRDGLGTPEEDATGRFPRCDRSATGGDTLTLDTSVPLSELLSTRRATITAENDRLSLSMTLTLIN